MIPLLVPDLPSTDEILPWLRAIDNNRWYSNYGPLCQEFEQGIVDLITRCNPATPDNCSMVSTCSGTTALEVGLSAYRLRPGTRVILPSLTFPATVTAVIRSGLIPVLADVDAESWVLTPEIAEQVMAKSGARVVMPVAAYGYKLDEDAWAAFAARHDCKVLIDAAGAFPAHSPRTNVDIAYSFHATKSLGIGEGGGILSVDHNFLTTAREVTNFGFSEGAIATAGMNAKLSEYHAAVGLCQIERYPAIRRLRQSLYRQFRAKLSHAIPELSFQCAEAPASPTLLVVALPGNAESACKELQERGVGARQWYCPPLHKHPAFQSYIRNLSLRFGQLQHSENLSDRLIGLPFHPGLTAEDMDTVVTALQEVMVSHACHRQVAPLKVL